MSVAILRKPTGTELEALEAKRAQAMAARQQRQQLRDLKKLLQAEAKLYAQVLIEEWFRLGEYYAFRWRSLGPEQGRRRNKQPKKQLVQFERYVVTPEAIYYKILTGRRGLFGYKSAIPHKVLVKDLVSDETLRELSAAVRHPVTSIWNGTGVWVVVHRNGTLSTLPRKVTHLEMLQHHPADSSAKGTLVLGVSEHRTIITANLEDYPHILIAGASRAGKSNMINNLLCQIIRFHSPDETRIVLIDPKRLEFSYYRTAPHLLTDIIYHVDDAIEALDNMLGEVERRTAVLQGRARKMSDFNRKYPREAMARIVIIVEEMAALMRSDKEGEQVKKLLMQIANLGRAVDVHLILCTQLPVVKVIPSTIKVSMWVRIAGQVSNTVESVTILSRGDAARLPGIPGRMIIGMDARVHETQTPLTTDDDVFLSIKIAKGRQLGWVKLDGWQPAIDVQNVLYALAKNPIFRRQVNPRQLAGELARYGISARQVRAFVEDLFKAGTFSVGEEHYTLHRLDNVLEIRPANEQAAAFVAQDEAEQAAAAQAEQAAQGAATASQHRPLWRIAAPPPVLLLPARAGEEPLPEPAVLVERFLRNRCAFERRSQVLFKHLYAAYLTWCDDFNFPEVKAQRFGSLLKGYKELRPIRRDGGQRAWEGLRLQTEEERERMPRKEHT